MFLMIKCRHNILRGGIIMANNGGGLTFWGMVGAILVALLIFALIG